MKLKAIFIGSASVLLAIYSAALLYEGFLARSYSGLLTFPFVDRPAAERAYFALPQSAPITVREAAAARLVRADPTNAESWMAVAYTDWLKHGRHFSPTGLSAFDHSYAMSYFDRVDAVWRIGFALDNWADLTPQIRDDVRQEADICLSDHTLRADMVARMRTVRNPPGMLAAAIFQIERPAVTH